MTQILTSDALITRQRFWIAILLCVTVVASFWSFSRYPDLLHDLQRSQSQTLLSTNIGNLSKNQYIKTDVKEKASARVYKHSINWIMANIRGMSFGMLFGSCILLLLRQCPSLRRQLRYNGFRGISAGILLGLPLGVCTNCATPIGVSMFKSGVKLEVVLATLITSPTLNPIGLILLFSLFSTSMVISRLIATAIIFIVAIPTICFLVNKYEKNTENQESTQAASCSLPVSENEAWTSAFKGSIKDLASFLWQVIRWTLPFMLITALLAAIVVTYYPLEFLANPGININIVILLATILGVLIPTPIFVDLILVYMLLNVGLHPAPATVFLITLGPVSMYSIIMLWNHVSRIAAILLPITIGITAITITFLPI